MSDEIQNDDLVQAEEQSIELKQQPEEEDSKLKEQLLRALADLENTRKRSAKEKEDALKYGATAFARDMISVCDNLRRAIDSVPNEQEESLSVEMKSMLEGVRMTERELLTAFEKHGIKKVDQVGHKFDHEVHQAMFEVESEEHEPGTIIEMMQPGYTMHSRLLRPALVGVSKKKPD